MQNTATDPGTTRSDTVVPAILREGFRPFFQFAALWAVVSVGLWIAVLADFVMIPSAFDPLMWHAHEAIFGFGAAAVAGFILTAVPNWTGRLPVSGGPLAGLVALWMAGRAVCFFSLAVGPEIAMAVDVSFLLVLAFVVTREIVAGRNYRNLVIVAAIVLLASANAVVHLEVLGWPFDGGGRRLGLAVLLSLISLIGGRVVPSFTRNWLAKIDPERLPAPFGPFDRIVVLSTVVALAAWTAIPDTLTAGVLLLLAGALNGLRLARWCGPATVRQPLLWVLHLGYGWLALGLVLLGAWVVFGYPWLYGAMHALSAGAIGTMVLAIMTRASLGHTGRPLAAGPGTILIYAHVSVGAAVRVLTPLAGTGEVIFYALSGLLWIIGFALFLALYGPMLWQPRR